MMKHILFPLLWTMTIAAADLPVSEVVLYKHGIGYFERSGKLGRGESARLEFNASEMNDVLKSLTITERGGGAVSGLRYDAMDPLSHRLAGFPFQIENGEPLSALFDRLKGARLEMRFGSEALAGVVVNGRVAPGGEKQPEREQVTLMLDSGELRTVDLSAATAIRFPDPQLQQQFREYLTAVSAARSKEKRAVYIDSTDSGERQISASYTIPVPVWKSSYRLIFGTAKQPTLEGWAIVDNTSGEDWKGVRLSLVSGRPISFVSQLYAPKYVSRPEAELPDDNAARPVVHEGAAVAAGASKVIPRQFDAGRLMAPRSAPRDQALLKEEELPPAAMASPSSIASSAATGELGELFEYRLSQPVTIRRDESAMLPFLQQSIEARKLLIYSDHSSQHPTNAAEISNSRARHWMAARLRSTMAARMAAKR